MERGFLERATGGTPVEKKSVALALEQMREKLASSNPSPLEILGAERAASCWLQLHYGELIYEQNLGKLTLDQDNYYQKRLDRFHRSYLSSMRSLAQVRKLLKPKIAQINLAEKQQFNTGAAALEPGKTNNN